MKLKLLQFSIWLHINLPVVAPILDRGLHLFGICLGH